MVTLGALITLGIVAIAAYGQVRDLHTKVTDAMTQPESQEYMQTLTQDVTRQNGDVTTVTSTRMDQESVADFIVRHDAIVAALKAS